jgi:hypothetical protein
MGDFADDYGGYDFYDRMELDEQRDNERRAQRAKLLTLPEPAQKPMHPELRKMWEDYFDKCFREFSAAQPAPVQELVEVDQATMELAESVGLIGPSSRTHDLHAAIQRFHDLICVNATIKAAKMAADAIRESTPPATQRQWRGLTDKEFEDIIMSAPNATVPVVLWQLIQDKLKEKNS